MQNLIRVKVLGQTVKQDQRADALTPDSESDTSASAMTPGKPWRSTSTVTKSPTKRMRPDPRLELSGDGTPDNRFVKERQAARNPEVVGDRKPVPDQDLLEPWRIACERSQDCTNGLNNALNRIKQFSYVRGWLDKV